MVEDIIPHEERKKIMNDNTLFATQTFIPGQVWFFTIDTSSIDGAYVKHRPYLIVAANNRRLTILKMTKHGENSSNWIYEYIPHDESERIILDTPITVDVKCITKKEYAFTFSNAMFKDIHAKFIAAMLYQSFTIDDEYMDMVNTAIENHEETFMSFSPYKMRFNRDYDSISTVDCDEEDMVDETADDTSNETPNDNTNTVIEPDLDIENKEPAPNASKSTKSENVKKSKTSKTKSKRTKKQKTKRIYVKDGKVPTAKDLIIPGMYDLKPDKIYNAAAKFNISSTAVKLELGQCLQNGDLMYINGNYKAALKSDLIANMHKSEVIEDSKIFGAANTAKMWGITVGTIYHYRAQSRE